MSSLTFEEKFLINLLSANNKISIHIENGNYNGESYKVNNEKLNKYLIEKIIKNEKILKEIISKGLIDEKYGKGIKNYIILKRLYDSTNYNEYLENIITNITTEAIENNIEKIHILSSNGIINSNKLKKVIEEKIQQKELDLEKIKKMLPSIVDKKDNLSQYIVSSLICSIMNNNDTELLQGVFEELEKSLITIIDNNQQLSQEEKEQKKKTANMFLKRLPRAEFDEKQLATAFSAIINGYNENYIYSFNRTNNFSLNKLKKEQIDNINIKNVNQILELAKSKFDITPNDFNLFVKIYMLFGKQRTSELIEGKYGEISLEQLINMFNKASIDEYIIATKNAEPTYTKNQEALINFFFASGPNDINANIKKIISGEIESNEIQVPRLLKEWNIYYQALGGQVGLANIKKMMSTEITCLPGLHELEPTLKFAGVAYYNQIFKTYLQMQKRTKSTIPKIKGNFGEYEYEMLDLKNPGQMNVGYDTYCCFTFGGLSAESLKHACTANDSRIFIVKKNNKIIAQSWAWRNGNTICFDNIEAVGVSNINDQNFLKTYTQAANEILKISKETEEEEKQVQIVTIGERHSKIKLPEKKLNPQKTLLCLNQKIYTDAEKQRILATSEEFLETRTFPVEPIYEDGRMEILEFDPQQEQENKIEKINKHINKINFLSEEENIRETRSQYEYTYVTSGTDWYIGIDYEGNFIVKFYGNDERRTEEIKQSLVTLKNKIKSGELLKNLDDKEKKKLDVQLLEIENNISKRR